MVGAGRFERPTPCAQGIGTRNARNAISLMCSMGWLISATARLAQC